MKKLLLTMSTVALFAAFTWACEQQAPTSPSAPGTSGGEVSLDAAAGGNLDAAAKPNCDDENSTHPSCGGDDSGGGGQLTVTHKWDGSFFSNGNLISTVSLNPDKDTGLHVRVGELGGTVDLGFLITHFVGLPCFSGGGIAPGTLSVDAPPPMQGRFVFHNAGSQDSAEAGISYDLRLQGRLTDGVWLPLNASKNETATVTFDFFEINAVSKYKNKNPCKTMGMVAMQETVFITQVP